MEKKEKINLKRLNSVIKKNSIKIIVILFLFTLCGYFYSYNMVIPKYKSTSTILLGSNNLNKENDSVTQTEVTLNKNLISTYGKILKSSNVLEQVIEHLNLDMTKEELYKNVQIEEVEDTQIIEVGVINKDPIQAQKIAEELNKVFIEEIKRFYKIDNINIVDKASFEIEPYNVNHIRDIFIFLGIGIVFSMLYISIIFFFDTTVKIEQDIEEFAGLNVIGTVPIDREKDDKELIVQNNSKSIISEALKTIRTNISYAQENENAKSILFTSCNSGEGKSWVASNMAVAYAWSNKNVIIVDADMRKGRQDKIFEVSNVRGLSGCLKEINNNQDFETLEKYIQETDIPKVHIMTMGAIPPNPSELLLSNKMNELIHMLKCVYDVVIIDGTPCNLVSDSIPVSRIVDTTIIVAESRKTKIEDLKNVIKTIRNAQGNIAGAILNKKEIKGKEYGKGYYYGKVEKTAKVEIKSSTVKELIANRKEYIEETKIVEENPKDNQITVLAEKIEELEDKLLEIPDINLESYTRIVEDVRKIYEGEIDKNRLAEDIKENIIKNELVKKLEESNTETKNILEQKLEQLNYEKEIEGLIYKVNSIEDVIHEDNAEEKITSMIAKMQEEQNKKLQELDNSNSLQQILQEIENLKENQNEKLQTNSIETKNMLEEKVQSSNTEIKNLINEKLEASSLETRDILTEKIEQLNYEEEIKGLIHKVNSIEDSIQQDNTNEEIASMITKMQEEQNKKIEELDSSKFLHDILQEIGNLKEEQEEKITNMISEIKEEQNKKLQELDNSKSLQQILQEIENLKENQNEKLKTSSLETRNMLEEKIGQLNYEKTIEELIDRVNSIEDSIQQDNTEEKITSVIARMQEEQSKKLQELDNNEFLQQILQEIENLKESHNEKIDNTETVSEIMKELKKINNRYDKLAERISANMAEIKQNQQARKTKNNVIELDKVKNKMKQEELIIEYGQEVAYEQLLDLAIEVYEIKSQSKVG